MGGNEEAKTERYELRLTPTQKAFLWDEAKKLGLSMTDYILVHTIHEPKKNDPLYSLYMEIIRAKECKNAAIQARMESYMIYIDKNGLKRILESARFSQFHLGKINMKEVNRLIDNTVNYYEKLPEPIKKLKEKGMKELVDCKDHNYLLQKLRVTQEQVKAVEDSHKKLIHDTSVTNIVEHVEAKKKNGTKK